MMKRSAEKTRMAAAVLATLAVLAGCASPEPRYYTLASGEATAPAVTPATTPLWIEVAPVRVPERLNRAQLVVADGSAGGLKLLDLSRWSSPLPDELRDALSQQLQARLGAVDTYQQGLSEVTPVYRVTTEVVRLDGDLGQRAAATIAWTVRKLPDGKVLSGRTQTELPAPGQVDGMVSAYRQIVATTAADIAAGVQSLRP
ncbi:PqiC family protein [Cupriavidus campinensis]|uniref:Membrane integrity-associated transporter subunit PqiC n=1 Tax=Cupriavidus campinensis TaxID=151783 RepID=A0AAE9I1J7_9BURK|nr:PqiC family protein [Cupriavidus campinensis]TSP13069.1 membrane integrity-associated transporter subunit PqiC [Cupriavidus campinensis]URF04853.1 PqiC family protein [Cupriavidus campinensis]